MRNDMTTGCEWKQILLFSFPIMAGSLLQQLYNTVDGIVVGNYVSENALAAVGTCASMTMVFLAIAMGMSSGAGIMVAQYFGAGQLSDLRRSVSTTIILNTFFGVVLSFIGWFAAEWFLSSILGISDPEILEMAAIYFKIYALGLIFQFVYNIIASILRAVGDSKATLYFLCVAAVMNLVLDLVFVIVFHWGVAGAAIATVISQAACAIVSWIYMVKKHTIFRFAKGEFAFDRAKCLTCLRLGIPTTLQHCVVSFSHVFIQRLVNSFGSVSMAAFTVGNRVENYVLIPIFGFNTGLATFTGQNVGAGKPERVRRGLRGILIISAITCIAISALTYIFAGPLTALFGVSGDAMARAVEQIRYISIFFVIFAIYMPTNGLLQGAGDVVFATIVTLSTILVRVFAAYTLLYAFNWGYGVAWQTMPMGWSVALVLVMYRFFSGKWQAKSLINKTAGEA